MIIDVHSHTILPPWRALLAARSSTPEGVVLKDGMVLPQWTPELAIEAMDANGIDLMILSEPAGPKMAGRDSAAALARRMNDETAEILNKYPGRFGAIATLPLFDMDEAIVEAAYALDELGFDGVGLMTNADGVYPGDEKFAPLLAEFDRRRTVAFMHPDTPAFNAAIGLPFSSSVLEFMFDTTRAVTSLIYSGMRRRYPNFSLITTHAGGVVPFLAARLAMATRAMPTGYGQEIAPQDVAEVLKTFHFDVTAASSPVALTALLSITTPDRLLAGFDFPYMPQTTIAPAKAAIDSSELLSDADRRAIYCDNALRLFPRLSARMKASDATAIVR